MSFQRLWRVEAFLLERKHHDWELSIPGGRIDQGQAWGVSENDLLTASDCKRYLAGANQLQEIGLETMLKMNVQPLFGEIALVERNIEKVQVNTGDVSKAHIDFR